MRNYRITVQDDHKHIVKGQLRLGGINPKGEQIGFTNYFMEKDGEPFFGICAEFHYARYDERYWEDEIIKIKWVASISLLLMFFGIYMKKSKVFLIGVRTKTSAILLSYVANISSMSLSESGPSIMAKSETAVYRIGYLAAHLRFVLMIRDICFI